MRDVLLIVHFLGLGLGLGTSFAFMFLGIAGSKMETGERSRFALNTFALNKMGHIGLTLLIISGFGLMTPYWRELGNMPLMVAKLILVAFLTLLIGYITVLARKAKEGDTEANLKKMAPVGRSILVVGLLIVVLAVYIFH